MPPFKGNLLIVLHLIFSLLFNPAKHDYSVESEATKKHYNLQPLALILYVDTQKLHHSAPLIQLIMSLILQTTSRKGHGGRGNVNERAKSLTTQANIAGYDIEIPNSLC